MRAGERFVERAAEHRDMAHLAGVTGFFLAVEMQFYAGKRQKLFPGRRRLVVLSVEPEVAEKIQHHRGGNLRGVA